MRTWPIVLAALFEIALGGLIIWSNADLLSSGQGGSPEKVWIGFGACLALTALNLLFGKGWARIALIVVASLLLLLALVYVARHGLHLEGGPQAIKLAAIVMLIVSQTFVVGALVFGWKRA